MSETTVRVPLTVEDRASKADAMARLIQQIAGIEAEAKERAAEFREEIKGLMAELAAIANVVQQGAEEKSQMALTFTESEAARALAGVGAVACTCEGGPDAEVKSLSCPVHGVESRGDNPAPCDGVHGQDVACRDPKCWLIVGPAEEPAPEPEVVHKTEEVDVIAPEEPAVVMEFRRAKAKRAKYRGKVRA